MRHKRPATTPGSCPISLEGSPRRPPSPTSPTWDDGFDSAAGRLVRAVQPGIGQVVPADVRHERLPLRELRGEVLGQVLGLAGASLFLRGEVVHPDKGAVW